MDVIQVYCRADLLPRAPAADEPAVMLEGRWPADGEGKLRWSLDEEIDSRHARLDVEATRLAAQLAEPNEEANGREPSPGALLAYLNALSLRYWFVKLLRAIAFFDEVLSLDSGQRIVLHASPTRDGDSIDVLREVCRVRGAEFELRLGPDESIADAAFPHNGPLRRLAGRLLRRETTAVAEHLDDARRVVLCGNPAILDPVCAELLRRGARTWWLYDRFSVGCWRHWQRRGAAQLNLNASLGERNAFVGSQPSGTVRYGAFRLTRPVRRWFDQCQLRHGARQTRTLETIAAHLAKVRPERLVLDEDATPLARAAIWCARKQGVRSYVVQHGAPYVRFGFAPPTADRLLVWGDTTRNQLLRWNVPAERIEVTGSPKQDPLALPSPKQPLLPLRWATQHVLPLPWRERAGVRGEAGICPTPKCALPDNSATASAVRDILFLDTVLARDERPDALEFHLTPDGHRQMIRWACAAVARLPGARLLVRLHPRSPDDWLWREIRAEFPRLPVRIQRRGALLPQVTKAACVLSCASSSGVEAMLTGVPVIQLLPPGSGDLLPADAWGFVGTARSEAELCELIDEALATSRVERSTTASVFAALGADAAARAVDAVLRPIDDQPPVVARPAAGPVTVMSAP